MTFTIKPISSRPTQKQWRRVRVREPRFFRRGLRRLLGPLLVAAIFIFLGGAISFAGLAAWVSRDLPNPGTLLDRKVALSTKIYDRTGEHLLYDIHGAEARTLVKLEDIPEHAKWAAIVIEDKNFYSHRGYALRSIFRAALANLFRRGRVQGGSTITQQFVKNAVLTPEKTFARKLRELILSIEIERRFTKDQILQLYFNEIPYGSTNYGLEAASQSYFGKSSRDLTVAEGATLAALPQAPTTYLNNPDRLLARRNFILDLMVEEERLTPEEAGRAKKEPLSLAQRLTNIKAPHFVLWVKQMLTETYGERTVEQGGLKVITTLDEKLQTAAEEAVTAGLPAIEARGGSNASLVALDPKTGHILAMVGSRDYFNEEHDGAVNVALRPRQPGSSFKPVVYAAGFMKGYTPTTILYDVVTTFKNYPEDYTPHNYDSKERGPVTVRSALQGSLNIPAVKMIYLAGVDQVLDLADALGYTTLKDRSRFGLSLVLGGGEVKLLEHVGAYAALANGGVAQEPVAILKVEDANGVILGEWIPRRGREAIPSEIAAVTTDILQDNNARAFIFGATNHLTLGDRPVAAKTGTTNDYRDAWTLGYVPSLAAGVWTGNNDNKEMGRGADGSMISAPIWKQFMIKALEETPPEPFPTPPAVVTGKPVLDGQLAGEVRLRIDRASGLLATELTPPNWVEERTYRSHHSILHYINKDDPRGEAPTDPAADPQYGNWEAALARWAAEQGAGSGQALAPTRFDDLHTESARPRLDLDSVRVDDRTLNVSLNVTAPRGVSRVVYTIDETPIATRTAAPFDGAIPIPDFVGSGSHALFITAYDDIDNSRGVNQGVQIE